MTSYIAVVYPVLLKWHFIFCHKSLKCHFNKRVVFFILLCCFVVCVGLVVKLGTDACKIKYFFREKGGVDEKRRDFKDF